LGTVLNKEPIGVDHRLNYHRSEDFNSIVIFKFQSVHLNAKHL
jgi:hypothetical protein